MKKPIALLLCIATILSLCACTGEVSPSNAPATPTTPTTAPTTEPSTTPTSESAEPTAAPTEAPSDAPSPEPDALPAEPSRVVTLDGEDITDRVLELWDYVNALYCDPAVDEENASIDILTQDWVEYAPLTDYRETIGGWLTYAAQHQLTMAQEIPVGEPLFVAWHDGQVYRSPWRPEALGELVDITVLLSAEDRMLLSMKYVDDDAIVFDWEQPGDEDCECVNFEIKKEKGIWLLNDYEFPGESFFSSDDAVGYDGDYWHWGEVSAHHPVITTDGEDIFDRVRELWLVARHKNLEAIGYDTVCELELEGKSIYYWELEGFEEILEEYYTEAGAKQLINDDDFVCRDGVYYKRGYYKSGVGVSGILGVDTIEVTDDRITLGIHFELSYLDPEGCTDWVWKEFVIAKEDGKWKIDDYEFIDY